MNFIVYELHLEKAVTKKKMFRETSYSNQHEIAQFFLGLPFLNMLDVKQ